MNIFKLQTFSSKIIVLIFITTALIVTTYFLPNMPQDMQYHNFADSRAFLLIPNFTNVLSNIFFVLVGVYGLRLSSNPKYFVDDLEKYPFIVLFAGLVFTGFGSAYYHWNPNNLTLFWDRASMTIVASGFTAVFLGDRISPKFGLFLLWPLVVVGIASVVYWELSEVTHHGDLRFYYFVSYYPIILLPFFLLFYPSRYTGNYYLIEAVLLYALAKITETFDKQIFTFTHNTISGHTIKHLLAAAAIYAFARYLKYRKAF